MALVPSEPSGEERMVKVDANTALQMEMAFRAWYPLVCGELIGEVGTWKPLDLPFMSLCRLLRSSSALWHPRILERSQAGEYQDCGCPISLGGIGSSQF